MKILSRKDAISKSTTKWDKFSSYAIALSTFSRVATVPLEDKRTTQRVSSDLKRGHELNSFNLSYTKACKTRVVLKR